MRSEKYIIREARTSDAKELVDYVQRLSDEPDIPILLSPGEFDLTVYEEEMILAEYLIMDNSTFLVVEAEGKIIGALNCKGGDRKAIRHVVTLGISIDRDWRNLGIGKSLLEKAIEWARKTGIVTRIELNVFVRNKIAIHLYEKYSFEVEGERRRAVYRNNEYEDELIMALIL